MAMKRMVGRAALMLAVLGGPTMTLAAGEGWTDNVTEAMATAAREDKDLLIDFTGSDWCGWCIKLKNEVFTKDEFKSAAPEHFVLVEMDFPRSKPQSDELKAQNNAWQQKFGIRGFPTIVLTDAKGMPYARTGYRQGGPEAYVKHLDELRAIKTKRDEAFAAAEKAEGIEKAKKLDAALSLIDPQFATAYQDQIKQIIDLDPNNEAGLKDKYTSVQEKIAQAEAEAAINEDLSDLRNLLQQGKFEDAVKRIDEAIAEHKPEGDLLMQLSMAKAQFLLAASEGKTESGDTDGALANLKAALVNVDTALEASPNNARAQAQIKQFRTQLAAQIEAQSQPTAQPASEAQ